MRIHPHFIMLFICLAAISFAFAETRHTDPPDYRNEKEAGYAFTETCTDKTVALHFIQWERGDDYYIATEIAAASSRVFIKVVRVVEKHKIAGREYYVASPDGRLANVEEERWWKELENDAPGYLAFVQGLSDSCKITYERSK